MRKAGEITIFEKAGSGPFNPEGGPMTKRVTLTDDGKAIVSDGSACFMSEGVARRAKFKTMKDFARCISGLESNEAIALGAMRDGLADTVKVVTKARIR